MQGKHGTESCDLDAQARLISRVSWLIADYADQLAEAEINPVIGGARNAIAVGTMIRRR